MGNFTNWLYSNWVVSSTVFAVLAALSVIFLGLLIYWKIGDIIAWRKQVKHEKEQKSFIENMNA